MNQVLNIAKSRESTGWQRLLIVALTAVVIIILDRITKALAWYYLRPVVYKTIVPGFFDLTYVENSGIAFGMFQGYPEIFTWLSIACVALVSYYIIAEVRRGMHVRLPVLIGWGGIIGGAFGNVYDRIFHGGKVIDFLDFYVGDHHWPAFNIADSAICVGVAMIILFLATSPEKKTAEAAPVLPEKAKVE